jgi:hypothetical protein
MAFQGQKCFTYTGCICIAWTKFRSELHASKQEKRFISMYVPEHYILKVEANLIHSGQEFMYSKSLCIQRVYVFLLLSMYSYCSSMYSYRCLCILIVVYIFLLLSIHSYCSSMYSYRCLCILIVVYIFLFFIHVFLTLCMYSYCSSMYSYRCLCILIVVYIFLDAATLTDVFPRFFLGCKANARV